MNRFCTQVRFVIGFDKVSPIPEFVRAERLAFRFAVIQHTFRPDKTDMFFDESLWLCILEFVSNRDDGISMAVVEKEGLPEIALDVFLKSWRELDTASREPPQYVLARRNREMLLGVSTEYWAQIGGPPPYSDSYTYSVFSKEYLALELMGFLECAITRPEWLFVDEPQGPGPQKGT